MLPIDPEDPRSASVKVAASIRSAILAGELKPGDQLPPIDELAKFFGVARQTVSNSIRALGSEGFVLARTGAGTFVGRAPTSRDGHVETEHAGSAAFLYEVGLLKRTRRAGWLLLGMKDPENVAEHSFRVGVVGLVLAAMEGADAGRVAALCLLHDVPETRIGDIPNVGRAYVTTTKAEAVVGDQTAAMPAGVGDVIRGLVQEYEAGETLEAKIAHDADRIEMLLQAHEYQAQGGYHTEEWQESARSAVKTSAGHELVTAIDGADPEGWWRAFAQSYRELRRMTRGKRDRS